MKKIYSLFATLLFSVFALAQTATLIINNANAGGSAVLGTGSYSGGAERVWTTNGIALGGKAITSNVNNTPSGSAAGTNIQMQANNAVIYNTTALPGKILSVSINYVGSANDFNFFGGNSSRLVNSNTGNYTVTGGTVVGGASTSGWTTADFQGTNYTYFAIKKGSGVSYITSIEIVYEAQVLGLNDTNLHTKVFVKNTLVDSELFFGTSADIRIFNIYGQIVKEAKVSDKKSLNVSDLPKGNYIITGIVNGEKISQKIIKK